MADPKIPYVIGVSGAGAKKAVLLTNLNTEEFLVKLANDDGNCVFDLANLDSGYSKDDRIYVEQAYAVGFEAGEVFTSESICLNEGDIPKATIKLTGVDIENLTLELTSDNSNWETATDNTEHLFTNIGENLKYRLTASAPAIITKVEVTYKYV